jgi:hypothetical protein
MTCFSFVVTSHAFFCLMDGWLHIINLMYGKHYHFLYTRNQCNLRLNVNQATIIVLEHIKAREVGFEPSSYGITPMVWQK